MTKTADELLRELAIEALEENKDNWDEDFKKRFAAAHINEDYSVRKFNGETYTATGQAYLTNRVFHGWWGDVETGESYTVEYEEPGIDEDGNEVLICWQFPEVKGEEPEDESCYPWENCEYIVDVSRVSDI